MSAQAGEAKPARPAVLEVHPAPALGELSRGTAAALRRPRAVHVRVVRVANITEPKKNDDCEYNEQGDSETGKIGFLFIAKPRARGLGWSEAGMRNLPVDLFGTLEEPECYAVHGCVTPPLVEETT